MGTMDQARVAELERIARALEIANKLAFAKLLREDGYPSDSGEIVRSIQKEMGL